MMITVKTAFQLCEGAVRVFDTSYSHLTTLAAASATSGYRFRTFQFSPFYLYRKLFLQPQTTASFVYLDVFYSVSFSSGLVSFALQDFRLHRQSQHHFHSPM